MLAPYGYRIGVGDPIDLWKASSRRLLLAAVILGVSAATLSAAVLTDAAAKAYASYADHARQAFIDRVNQPIGASDAERASLQKDEVTILPGGGDGIQNMPDSLLHHWRGRVFIPRTTLTQALRVSRA